MIAWAVDAIAPDTPFTMTLHLETLDSASDQDARQQAQIILDQLRVAAQLGPMSWHYCALITGTIRKLA